MSASAIERRLGALAAAVLVAPWVVAQGAEAAFSSTQLSWLQVVGGAERAGGRERIGVPSGISEVEASGR